MSDHPVGVRIAQEKMAAAALADPLAQMFFVDSNHGNDGNNGESARHPILKLSTAITRALQVAQSPVTIVCAPGGSETLTAGVTLSAARMKIVCPTDNPRSGFILTGAGTLDLITVSGVDCHVEGLNLKHTGATANAAGIKATAAALRLVVKNCVVDDTAIVTTKTGVGVELTAGADDQVVEGCTFLDTKYGVQLAAASTAESDRPVIKGNTFFVGGSAFFGVHMASATGKVQGPIIRDNVFMEADGDGTAASNAWDGTDGTNGTQGPILMGAAVDQYLCQNNSCYTALDTTFDNLNAINGGAAGDMVSNKSGAGGDVEDIVDTINTTTTATNNELSTMQGNVTSLVTLATATNNELSTMQGNVDSLVTLGAATNNELSTMQGNVTSLVTLGAATNNELSTMQGNVTSLVTLATATNNELSTQNTGVGTRFWITKSVAASAISTSAMNITGVSSGGFLAINSIIAQMDGTGLAGSTNIEVENNNANGLADVLVEAVANMGANTTINFGNASITGIKTVLETGKLLTLKGTAATGTGAGKVVLSIEFIRMAAGATIAAA